MITELLEKTLLDIEYQDLINEINNFENDLKKLTNSELREKSIKLQKQFASEQQLDELITQAFALTREASIRTLGLRHFNEQLLGGLVLNNQQIAEMKTGEGKTLVATLPAFLNSLTKKGVHIITVNDYLANRDQITMGQVYRLLGLDTGLIQESMSTIERKENYNADITYVTNYEITFDYLRDNIALSLDDLVLRPFNYCVIDEVDSVLIDEAQNPLIISDNSQTVIEKYILAAEVAKYLEGEIDYNIDEKNKNIVITEKGSRRIEEILSIYDLFDKSDPWIIYIVNALKAKCLYILNVHYIIQDNRIIIVDEFTGRIMPDRRWGNGLHQAVEAKEKLPIRQKTETIATITYQNFFLLYPKFCGMTGTGKTSEIEFQTIYKLEVKRIPTAQPNRRQDLPDLIYKDQFLKWTAIAEACNNINATGQPVLIGTKTVEKSEMLAQLLNEYKLSYQLLNAKPENVRREAEIIAQAGKKNSITIATNIAGRGTDIILGGNITMMVEKILYDILICIKNYKFYGNILKSSFIKQFEGSSQKFLNTLLLLINDKSFSKIPDSELLRILKKNNTISVFESNYEYLAQYLIDELLFYYKKIQNQENRLVTNLGGLYIIGTERNDSRRIDNQLRGRCGRQGDPGTSRFFLSLEDNLVRLFGNPAVQEFMKTELFDDSPVEDETITKSLDSAQMKIEEKSYQERKNLFDYDSVLNTQRSIVYSERKKFLQTNPITKSILGLSEQIVIEEIQKLEETEETSSLANNIFDLIENLVGHNVLLNYLKTRYYFIDDENLFKIKLYFFSEIWTFYYVKRNEIELYKSDIFDTLEKNIALVYIDNLWQEYLSETNLLKETVGWRGYGQKNPLYEYRKEAYALFQKKLKIIRQLILHYIFRSSIR